MLLNAFSEDAKNPDSTLMIHPSDLQLPRIEDTIRFLVVVETVGVQSEMSSRVCGRSTVAAAMRMLLQRESPQGVLQAQWHSPVQTHLSLLITNIFEYQPLLKTHHSRGELLHLTARVSPV